MDRACANGVDTQLHAGRKKLIFKLVVEMELLLEQHSCDLETKLLTPQKQSSSVPIQGDCSCRGRVNVGCGPAEERVLLTGLHAVADIYCENCKTTLGWKYEHAFESSQKYKEGKYIIELAHMIKDNGWD
ncbi:hypothetical protein MC885_000181 [Smutsia gigantea]|nr:hypothetical protein MC885_000181 [Smutsia gigantea]